MTSWCLAYVHAEADRNRGIYVIVIPNSTEEDRLYMNKM